MRIVHFSDWHASFRDLPGADLYICTGDMLRNFMHRLPPEPGARFWKLDVGKEMELQERFVRDFVRDGGFQRFMPDDVPIVCVRGNHDFIPLAGLFEGCMLIHELVDNELVEFMGIKITGHRGIPRIFDTWSDEAARPDLQDRMRAMPAADIYVTHYPPQNVLDSERPPREGYADLGEHYGLEGMADNLLYRGSMFLHTFGHIHECGGRMTNIGNSTFSNAACGFNVIDMPW